MIINWPLQKFARDTITVLPWVVQNLVAIWYPGKQILRNGLRLAVVSGIINAMAPDVHQNVLHQGIFGNRWCVYNYKKNSAHMRTCLGVSQKSIGSMLKKPSKKMTIFFNKLTKGMSPCRPLLCLSNLFNRCPSFKSKHSDLCENKNSLISSSNFVFSVMI